MYLCAVKTTQRRYKFWEPKPPAILTMPRMILQHLSYSPEIRLHSLPFEMTNIKMGMFWHEDLRDNLRHQFFAT